jgi:fatty-acyl-CoA synthase
VTRTWSGLLEHAARTWPGAEIAFPAERATFAAFATRAERCARRLLAAGARPGDHVGVLFPPCLDGLAWMFAVARIGATVVPISDRFKAAELRHLIVHADLTTIVTTDRVARHADFPALLDAALPDRSAAPRLERMLLDGAARPGFVDVDGLPGDAPLPAVPSDACEIAFVMYTSGTAAEPKGCLLTHAAVTTQSQVLVEHRYALGPGDAFWCPLPLFHNGGISTLTACLTAGATFCHPGHFDPATAVEQLEREHCTHWIPTFETIIMPILNHPRTATADLSALRFGISAGTPEFLERFQRLLPSNTVVSNYGSTEAAGSAVMSRADDPLHVRTHTNGLPLPGMELRIVDPAEGRECAPGEPGEIMFRGAMRFSGYYKDPEQTRAAIDADGWFHTGDRGTLGADGALTYLGRLKDMLKVGGENVAAAEIEAFLLTHPAIDIVAVTGVRDAHYTEVPAAFVELAPGAELTEDELIAYCVGSIATFKVPRYLRIVETWPMSGTKIRKHVLRDRLEAELDAAGIQQAARAA